MVNLTEERAKFLKCESALHQCESDIDFLRKKLEFSEKIVKIKQDEVERFREENMILTRSNAKSNSKLIQLEQQLDEVHEEIRTFEKSSQEVDTMYMRYRLDWQKLRQNHQKILKSIESLETHASSIK